MMLFLNQATIKFSPILFPLLWSTGFIGAKYGLPYIQPFSFLALRFLVVLILFGGIILVLRPAMPKSLGVFSSVFVSGLLIHGIYLGGVFLSIKLGMPAGMAAVMVGAQPVLTVLLANGLSSMKLLLVALLGFVGLLLVLSVESSGSDKPLAILTYLPVILSLLAITYGTIYQKKYCSNVHIISQAFLQYIPTGILFLLAALVFESGSFTAIVWHVDLFFALFWLAIVLSIGAVLLMNVLYQNNSANVAASYFYLSPPGTLIIAYFLFDEQLSPLNLLGICLVVLSVYLTTVLNKKFTVQIKK
ncbi:MAG: drug/metabolite transporter (DMT)-like permease [Pseudohongiellaceae bacterium]|jgi:drug/metabolite transporter (DMT)-like permease